jgi:hypothetical protein
MIKKQRPIVVTKEILLPSRRAPKAVLMYKYEHTSARFTTTALLGLTPVRSARVSAAHHQETSALECVLTWV